MKRFKQIILSNLELYEKFKKDFTYHSSAIEGSTITKADNGTIVSSFASALELEKKYPGYDKDEILENRNLGMIFDLMVKYYNEPLTTEMLKVWQDTLKSDTNWAIKYPNAVGKYRTTNVIVGSDENFARSFEFIPTDMKNFIDDINYIKDLTLDDICKFHCRFEKIHPFQDGNGRIGRLIMLKQCLQTDIIPFFINSATREEYINCMRLYNRTELSSFLKEYCLKQQKIFIQNYSEYLNTDLNDNEQKIINFLSRRIFANSREIGKILNLKKTATVQNINVLILKNIVEKNDSGKNSVYSLKNKK